MTLTDDEMNDPMDFFYVGLEVFKDQQREKAQAVVSNPEVDLNRQMDAMNVAYAEHEAKQKQILTERQERVRVATALYGESPPFSPEEAKELYEAGYNSGLECGADGGTFEEALRKLGR